MTFNPFAKAPAASANINPFATGPASHVLQGFENAKPPAGAGRYLDAGSGVSILTAVRMKRADQGAYKGDSVIAEFELVTFTPGMRLRVSPTGEYAQDRVPPETWRPGDAWARVFAIGGKNRGIELSNLRYFTQIALACRGTPVPFDDVTSAHVFSMCADDQPLSGARIAHDSVQSPTQSKGVKTVYVWSVPDGSASPSPSPSPGTARAAMLRELVAAKPEWATVTAEQWAQVSDETLQQAYLEFVQDALPF